MFAAVPERLREQWFPRFDQPRAMDGDRFPRLLRRVRVVRQIEHDLHVRERGGLAVVRREDVGDAGESILERLALDLRRRDLLLEHRASGRS